jgi:hypothetical protein
MAKKNYQDKLGDELVKKSEEARKLKKIGSKAAGLTSLLTGQSKMDLMRKEVLKRLPVVFMNLCEKKEFYQTKSPGNVVNLDKEIDKCDKYLDEAQGELTLNKSMEILDWSHKMDEKYGFESF